MTRDHDDDIVRRVHRALEAVAEATPIAPPRADDLREIQEAVRANGTAEAAGLTGVGDADVDADADADPMGLRTRPVRRNGHKWSSNGRRLALAAAVLVVALAAAATWMLRPNPGSPPAVQTHEEEALTTRLEAGWLPDRLTDPNGEDPVRTATRGLDVDLDAAVYQDDGDDGTLVTAEGVMHSAAADTVTAALVRLTRADERTNFSAGSQTASSAGVGRATVTWGINAEAAAPLNAQIDGATRLADVQVQGWTTIPVTVDWVPGIARSETVRYGDPALGPWAEVATTAGELPGSDVLDALLPDTQQLRIGDRTAWLSRARAEGSLNRSGDDSQLVLVVWQEDDGIIGSVMARGVSDEEVRRMVREARPAEDADPVPVVGPRRIGTWVHPSTGSQYAVEVWEDSWRGTAGGATQLCWQARIAAGGEPTPECGAVWAFGSGHGGEDGVFLYGAVIPDGSASVQLDEGTMDVLPLMPFDDDPDAPRLALVVGTEADAHNAVVSFIDAGGAAISTVEVLHE